MASADLVQWRLCWKVGIAFQAKATGDQWTCAKCANVIHTDVQNTGFKSVFALEAADCSAGHCKARFNTNQWGVCFTCNYEQVLRIAKRQEQCFTENCRRMLVVQDTIIKTHPILDEMVKTQFLALVDKHKKFLCVNCTCEEPLNNAPQRIADAGCEDSNDLTCNAHKYALTGSCNHEPCICKDCLADYLSSAMDTGVWGDLACFDDQCKKLLQVQDIAVFASAEVLARYNALLNNRTIEENNRYRRCARKIESSSCGNRQIVDTDLSEWHCRACGFLNCFEGSHEGHPGRSCEQAQDLEKNKSENIEAARKISKKCPKRGCNNRIKWEDWCPDIVCEIGSKGCGTVFCFICKIIYEPESRMRKYPTFKNQVICHLAGCSNGTARQSERKVVARPKPSDDRYALDWDRDPGYNGRNKWP